MNTHYNNFVLQTARNTPRNRQNFYYFPDDISRRLSTSINKRRNSNLINNNELYEDINTIDFDQNIINLNNQQHKRKSSYADNYFQKIGKQHNNTLKISSSLSNLNTFENNMEQKNSEMINKQLMKELNDKKKLHLFLKNINQINSKRDNIDINEIGNLIQRKKNNKINYSSSINNRNNTNQIPSSISSGIVDLKKSSFNNDMMHLTSKEPKLYSKDIINKNIESINNKLIEFKNQNSNIIESLENKINEIKRSVASTEKGKNVKMYIQNLMSQNNKLKIKNNILSNNLQQKIEIMNLQENKLKEILNDNNKKEIKLNIKEKEIENKNKEIINLNSKLNQLLSNFEKEKKDKERLQKQIEKSKEMENYYKKEIDKIKLMSKNSKLNNISSSSHKIIFQKSFSKYNLSWSLITIKNEKEAKNYINTFWISEEEMQQINGKMSFEKKEVNLDEDIDAKKNNINNEELQENKIDEYDFMNNNLLIESEKEKNDKKINNDPGDKKGYISMEKYIKIVNQLSEAKMKINELMKKAKENEIKNVNLNIQEINSNNNVSAISEEFSDFIKNDENGNMKLLEQNKNKNNNNNNINLDDTNKYLEKYIDDLEGKIGKIKNLLKILIQEMEYTNNLNNTLYNLLIVSGYDDQEAVFLIQEKQNKTKKSSIKK